MTFGSLFAGIGGFDLGLERAGMECRWQVEIDDYASRVLAKHWPTVRRWNDVRTFPPEGDWHVDVVCGGFPCQDISVAGKGAGLAGERSGLWYEFARIIGELRPRYVVVENVAALLTRGMDAVLGTLSEIGYDAEWHVIPASAVGAPHRRERVWIVAHANGGRLRWIGADARDGGTIPAEGTEREFCGGGGGCAVADAVRQRDAVRGDGPPVPATVAGRSRHAGRGQRDRAAGRAGQAGQGSGNGADTDGARLEERQGLRRDTGKELHAIVGGGWWQTEPDVGRVAHGVPARVDRLRGLGNAVVPQVVELIGRAIIEHHVNGYRSPSESDG